MHSDGVLFEGDRMTTLEYVCSLLRRDSRELHVVVLNAVQMLVVMVGMSAAFALRVGELLTTKFLPLLGVERRPCLSIIMLVIAG